MHIRRPRLRPLLFAATLSIGAILVTAPSWIADAGHLPVVDPQDTEGRLDVRRADVLGTGRPRWKIETYARWRSRALWDRGFVLIRLDTFGDERFDYYALVRSTGGRMRADLYRDRRRRKDVRTARLSVWRTNRRSVSVRIPLSLVYVGESRVHYTWAVQTLFVGPGCRRTCFDFAPNRGAVVEPLAPAPEPSPSATPTQPPASRR